VELYSHSSVTSSWCGASLSTGTLIIIIIIIIITTTTTTTTTAAAAATITTTTVIQIPWSSVLLAKLIFPHLAKKFPTLSGTRMFITIFTKAHLVPIKSHVNTVHILTHHIFKVHLILFPHLCLGLPNVLFPTRMLHWCEFHISLIFQLF
jgi:hypothetical protein